MKNLTIIDDGQFRYPVLTTELNQWETENGKIKPTNYELFCNSVEIHKKDVMVGTRKMIDYCAEALEEGAAFYRPVF